MTAGVQYWVVLSGSGNQDAIWSTTNSNSGPNIVGVTNGVTAQRHASWDGTSWTSLDDVLTGATPQMQVNVVPEPATFALLGLGLAGMGAIRRKRANRR